jgi:exopolysaccharide biosynthesis polyprenyl glycosylphosphotransferase
LIAQRTVGLRYTMLFCQVLLAILALLLTAEIIFTFFTSAAAVHLAMFPFYCVVLGFGLIVESMNRNRPILPINLLARNFLQPHAITVRQVCYAIGGLLVFLAVFKDGFISRRLLLAYVPLLYLTLLVSNYCLPGLLVAGLFRGNREERTLLIGSVARAVELKEWLTRKANVGLRIVGLLNNDPEDTDTSLGLCRLGSTTDIKTVIREHQVTQVILLALPENANVHRYLVAVLEKLGVRLLIVSNLEEQLHHRVVHVEDEGFHFITLREEPLENPLNQVFKWLLDVAIALPVVIFLLPPLTIFVWLLQRLQSSGPVFHRQARAGIQNRQFQILKFRTMHVGNTDISVQASAHDPRIFAAGRWLRRFSIDEIPQFWNVLKGEMSVVGPRPHLVEHNNLFAVQMTNYHVRTFVKPGITGLAQVRGFRGEVSSEAEIARRLESDIAYLESWSLALDLLILSRTTWQMIFPPKTAY